MDIKNIKPPSAAERPRQLEEHGDIRVDPYFWLNQRENKEVIDYLKAENEYCRQMMTPVKELENQLFDEITGRIKKDDDSVPYFKNGYFYYYRFEEEKEYPVYARKKESLEAPEEIMLDANKRAEGKAYYQLGALTVSPDNRLMAFSEDTQGRRIYTLRICDLVTGEVWEEERTGMSGAMAWANDNQHLFYTLLDEKTLRPFRLMRYRLGQKAERDVEVFQETDATYRVGVSRTKSGKYLMMGSYAKLTNEYRFLPADEPEGEWTLFEARNRDEKVEYYPGHLGDRWYIRTNWEAVNYRLMVCPEEQTGRSHWKEIVPQREDVLLEDFDLFRNFLVLSERKEGITRLIVHPFDGDSYEVPFEEDARLVYTMGNLEMDSVELRFGYQSMTTPPSVFDFNMESRQMKLRKQDEIVGGYSPGEYRSERFFISARDGARVPVSLVYRKDKRQKAGNPLLLYGYGSYGISMDPYFSLARISLLDRGFVFAIAHIRGGEEMGRKWYEDGKLLRKKNTFTDFIDVAEHLLEKKYAHPDYLFAMGGSAGGLLMGAVINMRPDLWKGVIAAVPFVDVVTTMLDDSIPLTTAEYDEWGNPHELNYYQYIKSYSPYDNIEEKEYPNLLVTTGIHDSQVQYWEPAKWVAKLRKMKKDRNLLLLHTNLDTGHSGNSGRYERFRETAMEYAFLLYLAGVV